MKFLQKNTYKNTVLKESQIAAMEEFLDNIKVLVNVMGYKVLEPLRHDSSQQHDRNENFLYLKTGTADAVGEITSEGFVVLKGSRINEKTSEKSLSKGMKAIREKHIASGLVNEEHITTDDILFSSSSATADFVTGYSVSGPAVWKNIKGKSLREIESE